MSGGAGALAAPLGWGALGWVALGGALGATLRFLASQAAARLFGGGFPYGTLFVNAVGSALMGVAAAWLIERAFLTSSSSSSALAPLLMTGLLGGFTTFSAFSLETLGLLESGRLAAAALYVVGSVVLCLACAWLGLMLGRAAI